MLANGDCGGDCNTFRDHDGACYKALVNAAGSDLIDVRHEQKNEFDAGRQRHLGRDGQLRLGVGQKKAIKYDQMAFQQISKSWTAVQEDSFVRSDGSAYI